MSTGPTPRTLLTAALIVTAMTLPAYGQRTNQNVTPDKSTAVLYQPCAFDVGSASGPLLELATYEHYTYTEFTNAEATLDKFATLGSFGVIQITTHGSPSSLRAECYQTEAARNTRFNTLCPPPGTGTVTIAGVHLTCNTEVYPVDDPPFAWGISLSSSGVNKLLRLKSSANRKIVFLGACQAFGLSGIFDPAQVELLGYNDCILLSAVSADTQLYYRRSWGQVDAGKARETGKLPAGGAGSCTALGRNSFTGSLMHQGPGNTTLAPIVAWTGVNADCTGGTEEFSPNMTNIPGWGHVTNGSVTFDTKMKQQFMIPSKVITGNGGCDSTIQNVAWTDAYTLRFQINVKQQGYLRLTVHNDQAVGRNDGSVWVPIPFSNQFLFIPALSSQSFRLDGNLRPPDGSNGVGPNQDDFISDLSCDPSPATAHATMQAPSSVVAVRPSPHPGALRMKDVNRTAAPGKQADGFLELGNTGATAISGLSLVPSALSSGANEIPASAITLVEPALQLAPGAAHTVRFFVQVPAGQPGGLYTGTVRALVNGEDGVEARIEVRVKRPPVIRLEGAPVVHAGDPLQIRISAADPEGDPIVLSASSVPAGATLTDNGNGTGILVFTDTADSAGRQDTVMVFATSQLPGVASPPVSVTGFHYLIGGARPEIISVSDANLARPAVAPGSLAAAFPGEMPPAGATFTMDLVDSAGVTHAVESVSTGGGRIRYLVPADAAVGTATLRLTRGDGGFASGPVTIETVAPALYSADGTGRGRAAAQLAGAPDGSSLLTLSATGIRNRSGLGAVEVLVNGTKGEVLYAGPDPAAPNQDQIRVRMPAGLPSLEQAPINLTVDGKPAFTNWINIP